MSEIERPSSCTSPVVPSQEEVLRLLRLWLKECPTDSRHTLTRAQVEALVGASPVVPSQEHEDEPLRAADPKGALKHGDLRENLSVESSRQCAHKHTKRQVGCVSCVLVFDRPAEKGTWR